MPSWLTEYCTSQDGLIVIPIEALSPKGIDSAFARDLIESGRFEQGWINRFDRAYTLYWQRAQKLHSSEPSAWFPPRCQHIGIVTRAESIRPYHQPFHQSAWLLYAEDFDRETSSNELAVFLFFQAERLGLMRQIVPAFQANLAYFLTLGSNEIRELKAGCAATTRPDAPAYRALGAALNDLRGLYHRSMKPPRIELPGAQMYRENGLIVPASAVPVVQSLQTSWQQEAQAVLKRYRAHFHPSPGDGAARLGAWLEEHQPKLLITGQNGEVIWKAGSPTDPDALEHGLPGLTEAGVESIKADLELVDYHSCRFLGALTCPEDLVEPAPHMTASGLCYVHREHKLIAYDIGHERNQNRLWEATPPFERLMLGARTIHEWGHLAAESGWVAVPSEMEDRRAGLVGQLEQYFDALHAQAPAELKKQTQGPCENLVNESGSVGKGLCVAMLKRIEDYMANLLARKFLSAHEMDTYVRNNVASRVTAYRSDAIYMHLIRVAYEFQYLRLSRIENPMKWFLSSTWFRPLFVERGVISVRQFEELVEIIRRICDCYSLDESRFKLT